MRSLTRALLVSIFALAFTNVALAEDEGKGERAGKKMDEAADKTEDAAKGAAHKTKRAAKKAKNKTGAAVEKAGDEMQK